MCMDPKPKTPKENKITVLGLGRSGGRIVHYLQEKGADFNLLYADDDEQSLMESTVNTTRVADCKGNDIEKTSELCYTEREKFFFRSVIFPLICRSYL